MTTRRDLGDVDRSAARNVTRGGGTARSRPAARLALALVLALAGCARDAPRDDEHVLEAAQAEVTSVVPDSEECNLGVGPNMCVFVAPTKGAVLAERITIDGKRTDSQEWVNATEVPYTDPNIYANGRILLRASGNPAATHGVAGWLYVYLEDIPSYGDKSAPLLIFVDHRRFTSAKLTGESDDRVYEIPLGGGPVKAYRPTIDPNNNITLSPVAAQSVEFARENDACIIDPADQMPQLWRCHAELKLPLTMSDVLPPDQGLRPGIGFAVLAKGLKASMPEAIAVLQQYHSPNAAPWIDRRNAETLLFGPPKGFPVGYMSWNMKLSDVSGIAEDFLDVDDFTRGEWLGGLDADVVALQEGWNKDRVKNVLDAANARRDLDGKPIFHAYGSIDFTDNVMQEAVTSVAMLMAGGTDGTAGGLWIFSRFEQLGSTPHVWSVCRGEDCLAAKGVQHVRLNISPRSLSNSGLTCKGTDPSTGAPAGCLPWPSGSHYVDVFNVHMQNPNPSLCEPGNQALQVLIDFIVWTAPSWSSEISDRLMDLAQSNFNCDKWTDAIVHNMQMDELNQFIEDVTAGRKDRPVVIMGDFNIDGKQLDLYDFHYGNMLLGLNVGPFSPAYITDTTRGDWSAESDIISQWPDEWNWDIDHGDVARDRRVNPIWWHTNPECFGVDPTHDCETGAGTFIGANGDTVHLIDGDYADAQGVPGPPAHYYDFIDQRDGSERDDYIFVRPAVQPDAPNYAGQKWVAKRIEGREWSSPCPGTCDDTPPARLSDHKPVMVAIEHAPLTFPPAFHWNWSHDVKFSIVTANATGFEDCSGCGQVDLRPRMVLSQCDANTCWNLADETGYECTDTDNVGWPVDGWCMSNWQNMGATHNPGDRLHTMGAELWDIDAPGNPDDHIHVFSGGNDGEGDWPRIVIDYDQRWVGMLGYDAWADPGRPLWEPHDNGSFPICSGYAPPYMCLDCTVRELVPGLQ